MDQLAIGFKGTVAVLEVQPCFDSYAAKPSGETMWCHLATFEIEDGSQYRGQVCASSTIPTFNAGDIMDIAVKSYTKGIYTLAIESVISPKKIQDKLPKAMETEGWQDSYLASPIKNLYGTPGDLAIKHAVAHHQNRLGATAADVIRDAEIFAEFIRNNTN